MIGLPKFLKFRKTEFTLWDDDLSDVSISDDELSVGSLDFGDDVQDDLPVANLHLVSTKSFDSPEQPSNEEDDTDISFLSVSLGLLHVAVRNLLCHDAGGSEKLCLDQDLFSHTANDGSTSERLPVSIYESPQPVSPQTSLLMKRYPYSCPVESAFEHKHPLSSPLAKESLKKLVASPPGESRLSNWSASPEISATFVKRFENKVEVQEETDSYLSSDEKKIQGMAIWAIQECL